MRMKLIITLFVILLISPNIMYNISAEKFQNDVLLIECETEFKLNPGEKDVIQLNFTNIGNSSINIYLEWVFIECGDLTHGEFSENFFTLPQNDTKEVSLYLEASKAYPQGCEDGVIVVNWGRNLNLTSWGSVDWDTKEGEILIGIDIAKDSPYPYLILGLVALILIITFIVIFWYYFKRKGENEETK